MVHGLLRSAAWCALVLALAHPVWQRESTAVQRVLVVDRSASMIDTPLAALGDLVRSAPKRDRAVWLEVGATASGASEVPGAVDRLQLGASASTSDLDQALARASASIPAGAAASVWIVSDGLATSGFPTRSLSELWARGIPVSWLRAGRVAGDVRPVALEPTGSANSVRAGVPAQLEALVEGLGQVVTCVLRDRSSEADGGGVRELARVEHVRVDGPTRVPFLWESPRAGFPTLELAVEIESGQDARPGNEVLMRTLAVQDPLRVAYLGERMQGGAERLGELLGAGFAVNEPSDSAELVASDVVVIDDRPAQAVPAALQESLVQAVTQEGLGLVMAGGESAFGPGGYHNQPIEDLLPVEMVQKEEKRDPSTSLVLIIDTSGSMGGNRVQLAKQVSRLAIRRLLPHDKVGIVEFYGAKRWAVPLQPASNSIEIERALNRLDAGGGTVILPAIEEAYYGLQNVRTRYKHVLILTDGGVESGAFEPLLRRMADDGINVSTVLIGPDAHSEFLVNLANWGQGRFYSVPDRFNLPEILLKQPASAKLPSYRPGTVAVQVHGGRGWWGEVDASGVPGLAGYVETRLRPGAERVIDTALEHHPILASWRYGLGRVSALMTEPTGPGTEPWQHWPGYGALMARVMLRTADDGAERFAFGVSRDGDQAIVVAEARRSEAGQPSAKRVGSEPADLVFAQVSPNRWEARFTWSQASDALLEAGAQGSLRSPQRLVLPASSGEAQERQVPEAVAARLGDWIGQAGGRVLEDLPTSLAEMPFSAADRSPGSLRLGPWLALLALVLYLLDLLYRRMPRTSS